MPRPTPRGLELYARGQDAERQGNISGARRFFAGAAEQGSAAAARSLGQLYDPAYLKQTVFGGIDPDPALARNWYQRAAAMGDAEAGPLLEALAVR
jgi:TPR repeat protein